MSNAYRIARLSLTMLVASLALPAASVAEPTSGTSAATSRPHHARPHHRHRQTARIAPVPPQPAATPVASGTSPAPVPNEALTAPIDHTDAQTSVAPSVFQLHYPPQGDGYVTGSSPQAMDDRNAAKATGVQARVPLPQ
jgi:hypothetical protein